jgi:PHD finger-like domain-containing protein 5A
MARHARDLYLCRNLPGTTVGMVCNNCDGRCPVCDSHTNQATLVRLCDECAFRQSDDAARCVICNHAGAANDAYYCRECVQLEKDRDGCPKVKNLSMQKRARHHSVVQKNADKPPPPS